MGTRIRPTSGLLALVAALLVALAVIPAFGDHLPSGDEEGGAGTLSLHVGSDDQYFEYDPSDGPTETQQINATRCEIELEEPPNLASFSGNAKGPGLNGISIGIKSGGAQGVPCGRIDTSENLTLSLEDVPLAAAAELDLELKGGAKVTIETYLDEEKAESFQVRSGSSIVLGEGVDGTSGDPFSVLVETDDPGTDVDESIGNCKNLSDSGPDAGSRDNCRVTVHPSLPFDSIRFVPTVGEVSLEGSGDFGNVRTADTIFYLTTFEGVLDCGDEDSDSDGDVDATIIRHSNTDGSECVKKPYRLFADGEEGSVTFEIDDPGSQEAFYEAFVTFDQALTTPLSAVLQYDPEPPYEEGDFKDAEACDPYPFELDGNGERVIDPETGLAIPNPGAIPADHEACIISVTQEWDGTTTWHAVFMGDWKFR